MIDARREMLDVLQKVYAARYNSFASYILQAEPYVEGGDEALLTLIREVAEGDGRAAFEIGTLMQSLSEAPHVPAYDPFVTELNYLSIRYLAGRLITELEKDLDNCRELRQLCYGKPFETLNRLIEDLRLQIDALKKAL